MNEELAQQVQELKDFFAQKKLPDSIQLSPAEKIIDMQRFLDSHFTILETQADPRNYEVFLLRLVKLRDLLTTTCENDQ